MARTAIARQAPPKATDATPHVALVLTAADIANNNSYALTGRELLLVNNTDTVSHTYTITSTADDQGRTADIGPITLAAGGIDLLPIFKPSPPGWQQSDGSLYLQANSALVKFAVVDIT